MGEEGESFLYDVFLSFRGEDTRLGFTGNLYNALVQRKIRTFMDDQNLRSGDELRPALFKAIQNSKTAIIVFSHNYAFSTFCLDELAVINDCFEGNKNRLLLPVFFDVDPSHVRKQEGSYAEALNNQEIKFKDNIDKVNRWKNTLRRVANLKGLHFNPGDGYEYKFIGRIIKEVSRKIDRMLLHVAKYPVGLDSSVQTVKSLLNRGSNDVVHMIGIFGPSGVGKTTIARAVYNSIIDQFEDLCFLEDVGENSRKYGLVYLQRMLLSKITGDNDIHNKSEGIARIKARFPLKKIFLVVDDVDNKDQLDAIVGAPDWFGCGSKVIITTRDKGLLTYHKIDVKHEVKLLKDDEAQKLLCWNAFKNEEVDPSYASIISQMVTYASGLPLALEVIGSDLCGKKLEEWKLALERYKRIPDKKIQDMLSVSFDSLEKEEREVFLDIACSFGGYKLSEVESILHAHHGSSMRHSINLLNEKCLINIDDDDIVRLHHLIQEMGREIVRQESPEPSERSRLWSCKEVVQVLEENKGTSKIKILMLDFPEDDAHLEGPQGEEKKWNVEAISKMENLKTLIKINGCFFNAPTHLPNSLRVLKWSEYPAHCLPQSFQPKKLSVLELRKSSLRACEPVQAFTSLKILDFSYSEYLTEIPDVSGIRNLEKLSFRHCQNLSRIHESVGNLINLKILDAVFCINLRTFPPFRLTSLKELKLSHCSNLESFPEILVKMENITELHIMRTPIKKLPSSIQNLTRLRILKLQYCGTVQLPSSIIMLAELGLMHVSDCEGLWVSEQDKDEVMKSKSSSTECLILSQCHIPDDFFPVGLTWFANVKVLNLSGNIFTSLHACFNECNALSKLTLDNCRLLREIKGIPRKLETLSAKGCISLKELDLMVPAEFPEQCHPLRHLILDDCTYLQKITGDLSNLDNFSAKNCSCLASWFSSMLLNQEYVEAGKKMFFLPGTRIPDWFVYQRKAGPMSFWFRKKFPAVSLCLFIGLEDYQPTTVKFSPTVSINDKKLSLPNQKVYEFSIETEHIFLFDLQLLKFEDNLEGMCSNNEWNHVKVSYVDHNTNDAVPIEQVTKQIGFHVDKQTSSMYDIKFTNPSPRKRKSDNLLPCGLKHHHLCREKEKVEVMGVSETRPIHICQNVNLLTWPREQLSSVSIQAVVKRPLNDQNPWEDTREETSERVPEDKVHPTIQNKRCHKGDDVKAVSSSEAEYDESSSNSKGSDSDNPFDLVMRKLSINSKETISAGGSSDNAYLTPISKVIDDLELLMAKELSEVSSDPAMQFQLHQLLDRLNTNNHHKVKEAIVEFRRKASASFQEFEATVDPLNKLKNFEEQKARIQKDSSAGSTRWNDLRNSIKKASSDIKAKNRRKKELELEIANSTKELQQIESDVKNQEAACLGYLENCRSLDEQARALSKKADDLLAANRGVENEGEAAKVKQNRLKLNWSTHLPSMLNDIKISIFSPS